MFGIGLMKHMEGDEGADVFLPLLIYVVIRTNPPRLISNVQYVEITTFKSCLILTHISFIRYISRFRSPEHLSSEAGYYLTNLVSCVIH